MQHTFENFYTDAHLSTVMFINKDRRTLDFHFLLWNFDVSRINRKKFDAFDQKMGLEPVADKPDEGDD